MTQHPSTASRRQFIATTASAVAAATIVPRHVLGGPGFVAPSDKVNVAIIGVGGQGLHNARALFQEKDCQIIAIADPAEEWDLSSLLLRREGRPWAGASGDRADVRRENADLRLCGVRGLPRDAGGAEGDRRGPDRHPGPPPRVRVDLRDEGRQARLLREAPDPQRGGGPHGRPGRARDGRRDPDGEPGPLGRGTPPDGGVDPGRGHRCGPGGARLERVRAPLPAARAGRGGRVPSAGAELGSLARPPGAAALPTRVRAVYLAWLLGLRRRDAAGHGGPQHRPGLQRTRAPHAADDRGHGDDRRSGEVPAGHARHVPLRGAGEPGSP